MRASRGQATEGEHRPARPDELERRAPRLRPSRRPRSRRRRPRRALLGAEPRRERRRSGREPTPTGQPPASATHAQSISPIGPSPITATVSPRRDSCRLYAVEAAGERLHHRGELGRDSRRDSEQVRAGDPLRDEDELAVRAVEEREEMGAERLLAPQARRARPARRRVGGDDAPAGRDVDAAELVSEGARRRAEQNGMPAPERLQIGAVGERHLDLDEDIAVGRRLGPRHVLERGAGQRSSRGLGGDRLPARVSQGTRTTFSAEPLPEQRERLRRTARVARPSARGSSSSGRSATACSMCAGVDERDPITVSSRRYIASAGSVPASAKRRTVPPGTTVGERRLAATGCAERRPRRPGPSGATPARCGPGRPRRRCRRAARARRRRGGR